MTIPSNVLEGQASRPELAPTSAVSEKRCKNLNLKSLKWWREWALIFVGCAVMASGFVFFINPYNIVPGGVYGLSIVMHNIIPSIQVGTFGYCFDIPLLIISVLVLGGKLGARTIVAAMAMPTIMNTISWLAYPDQAALQRLDPAQLLGGCMDMTDHLMLTTIIGSVLIGLGVGIVVRQQATTGGSDIVAMMLQKFFGMRFSSGVMFVDSIVVSLGLLVIGFGVGRHEEGSGASILLSLYSLISIYIAAKVIARVLNGAKDDKLVFVISNENLPQLQHYIINDMDRTATRMQARGIYSDSGKEILFIVVSYKEVGMLKAKIKEADPKAFVIVTDAYDTYGEGWKPLPAMGELQPE